ncbi:hypothetical protein KK083_03245 [Fulvivirgaceae bacterium PWU4]|uniref:Uncharacterized protein n=1 Tax=Chryseosolibacter histidini TaxID=2782349 RepID=A0AAP2DI96_9BACT|nr:hypothetical protein [Chryseosolibacter histidini]MBT1695878.1 hypothetical protein [Chryseosolibacter histidini]
MKKASRKEIRNTVASVMHQTLFELQVAPTKKIKKLVTDASKKFADEIKNELKKQIARDEKVAKKQLKTKRGKKKKEAGSQE